MADEVGGLPERVHVMEAGFSRLEQKMDAGFAQVEARFAQVDGRFATLERKMDQIIDLYVPKTPPESRDSQ